MPTAAVDLCFRGQSGHGLRIARGLLVSQSGHAANGLTPSRYEGTRYRTVLRSSTVLSNTKLIVQIQRLPMNASGYRQ